MKSNSNSGKDIYKDFASSYRIGKYDRYSARMAELMPDILGYFSLNPVNILDLACGEGTFAIKLAELGYQVTGVDLSEEMLKMARESAKKEGREVKFLREDMREISFSKEYDLVTCWFDSMNYLLSEEDWKRVFKNVRNSLTEDGVFIFDMNTLYGLSVEWQNPSCYVAQDKKDIFEVHRKSFDEEHNSAVLNITGFLKENDGWTKFQEKHQEVSYPLEKIEKMFSGIGFEKLACWNNPEVKSEPDEESGRVWYVLEKV